MGYVQLAEELAQHLGEVLIVVDVGEEGAVVVGELLPVHAVHILAVEACFFFADDFFVHDLTLADAVDVAVASHRDGLRGIRLRIERHGRSAEDEELRALLVRSEEGRGEVHLLLQLRRVLAHIIDPEVLACFGSGEVEELLVVGREDVVAEARRGGGDAYGAQVEVVPFDDAVGALSGLSLLRLRGVGLGLLLGFLEEGEVFVVHAELLVSRTIEEDRHDIVHRAPRSVVAHTILIGSVEEDVPIGRPARVAAEVTAVREVLDGLTTLSADDTYVGVGPTATGDIGEGDPLPVG